MRLIPLQTSSLRTDLYGTTVPRIKHAPERCGTVAKKVVGLANNIGLKLDPWQGDVIRDAMSISEGLWVTPRVAVSVPRQNGKGGIIEAIEVAFLLGVFGADAKLLIHSAHEFKTAQNGFQRLLGYFDSVPALAKARDEKRVRIGTAAAREFIEVDGRTVKFFARSKGSGRGFSADFLILDEAQELSEDVWAAILPTISARPNPQVWLFGTPPDENMNGEVFTRFRDNGLEGKDKRLAYFEWSCEPGADPGDESTWLAANPAAPHRIALDSIRDEYLTMDSETFARERLGMWDGVASLQVIDSDTWAALAGETDPEGRVCFAIDVSPDRARASIGVAGFLPGSDRVMVQAIENRKGTGWIVPRLKELTERWPYLNVVVDSAGGAAALIPELKRLKIKRVHVISSTDVVRACGGFYDAAMHSRLSHPDQPILNDALSAARKRPLGDAWAWQRKDTASDITPLVAVTFAAYGLSLRQTAARKTSAALVL